MPNNPNLSSACQITHIKVTFDFRLTVRQSHDIKPISHTCMSARLVNHLCRLPIIISYVSHLCRIAMYLYRISFSDRNLFVFQVSGRRGLRAPWKVCGGDESLQLQVLAK